MTPSRPVPPPAHDLVLVGRIGAAHGIKGEVRLVSFTEDPKAIGDYGALQDADGKRRFEIATLRRVKDNIFIARFVGISTRDAAEALNNLELYLPRAALPAAAEGEFYHADLIGLAAVDGAGTEIGRVLNVLNFGGGDILEIAPAGGGETLLLPFTTACVPSVDLAAKRLLIVPPIEIEAVPEGDDLDTFR
ncbi:16S rRNA processing protein RimM [Methylovirgula ligni]|uniref:Ribosome maturation factor RimM n=1 Tax=Methylovirgula ligni TaxID=569860 RepID=A0A3D9YTF5_9HYPH|nr:ribosome maturation factor RimM [Methylovirgula ligni]QAY94806.1 16S rRNA processing protein RimM [Methylovirgula ligni]REF84773.1 16S rRNA processing protein RimM [Methylovirgula ligni]